MRWPRRLAATVVRRAPDGDGVADEAGLSDQRHRAVEPADRAEQGRRQRHRQPAPAYRPASAAWSRAARPPPAASARRRGDSRRCDRAPAPRNAAASTGRSAGTARWPTADVAGHRGPADHRREGAGGAADHDVLRRAALQPDRVDEDVEQDRRREQRRRRRSWSRAPSAAPRRSTAGRRGPAHRRARRARPAAAGWRCAPSGRRCRARTTC